MIFPAGKIREQVKQAASPYDVIKGIEWMPTMKTALINPLEETQEPQAPAYPQQNQVNQTMQQSRRPGMQTNVLDMSPEQQKNNPWGEQQQEETGGLSPFLVPDGSEEEDELGGNRQILQELQKVRSVAKGFTVNLKRTKMGSFELTLTPPPGYKIHQTDKFVSQLMKQLKGEAEEYADPDPNTQTMKIVYKSALVPTKIMKGKNAR